MKPLTQERLRAALEYDRDTGAFRWRVTTSNCAPAGSLAAISTSHGYRRIQIDGKRYAAHRLAWFYVHGVWPQEIDHINCDPSDNRLANLRPASRRENVRNSKRRKDNSTGFKGVNFYRANGKYGAHISVNHRRRFFGLFATAKGAHTAYVEAAAKLHGQFANDGEAARMALKSLELVR